VKKLIGIILLYTVFALPIPIAIIGTLCTGVWLFASIVTGEPLIATISAALGVIVGSTYLVTYVISLLMTCKKDKISLKSFFPMAHCLVAVLYLLSLTPLNNIADNYREYFGFAKNDYIVVKDVNDYGGFPADGYSLIVLDCSKNTKQALLTVKDWKKLPMTPNLDLFVNGGVKHGCTYHGIGEELEIPHIKNGYYLFVDDHSESRDPEDDTRLFDRASYNLRLAIYDTDTNKVYIIEYDT